MDSDSTKVPRGLLDCLGGIVAGYLLFAVVLFWREGDFLSAPFALLLHAPVFIIYITILLFFHRRWPHMISRAALVVCGVAIGLFPLFGVYPVYYWRLQYAVIILGIQVVSIAFLVLVTYAIAQLSRRLRET
jgi:hypothetical protein